MLRVLVATGDSGAVGLGGVDDVVGDMLGVFWGVSVVLGVGEIVARVVFVNVIVGAHGVTGVCGRSRVHAIPLTSRKTLMIIGARV